VLGIKLRALGTAGNAPGLGPTQPQPRVPFRAARKRLPHQGEGKQSFWGQPWPGPSAWAAPGRGAAAGARRARRGLPVPPGCVRVPRNRVPRNRVPRNRVPRNRVPRNRQLPAQRLPLRLSRAERRGHTMFRLMLLLAGLGGRPAWKPGKPPDALPPGGADRTRSSTCGPTRPKVRGPPCLDPFCGVTLETGPSPSDLRGRRPAGLLCPQQAAHSGIQKASPKRWTHSNSKKPDFSQITVCSNLTCSASHNFSNIKPSQIKTPQWKML
jgi:hypothetical protein